MSTAISFKFNGETKTKRTDNVAKAFADVRPSMLHTEMYVTIKHNKHLIERRLPLIQARKVFADSTALEIFINNLMLEKYV